MKKIILLLCLIFVSLNGYCQDDTFTVNCSGVDILFKKICGDEVECAYNSNSGTNNHCCIDWNYTGEVIIPETVEYGGTTYRVTGIGSSAFAYCDMSSLTLPSTLNYIGSHSISGCRSLHEIRIPRNVTLITEGAFDQNAFVKFEVDEENADYCSVDGVLFTKDLKTLLHYPLGYNFGGIYDIPYGVTRVGDYAFDASQLTSVTIPATVTSIGIWAFHQCSMFSNVFLPGSLTYIGEGACTGRSNIISIDVDPNNPEFAQVDGVVYTKDGNKVIAYPVAKSQTSYSIIEGTKEIYGSAFSSADNLESISIPNTVTKIGSSAFFSCKKLKSVDIPSSVTELGPQAFDYCDNLTSVYLHSAVPPTVSWYVFGGNENLNVYVPYQHFDAYRNVGYLTRAHIDPAIDWHDNHWTWVFTCIVGVDFTKSPGVEGYIVCSDDGGSSAKSIYAKSSRSSNSSPLKLVKVDKAGPGECVILKVAETGKTYGLATDETAVSHPENLLVGVTETSSVSSTQGSNTNYIFDGENFVELTSTESVTGGLGYLQIPTEKAQALGSNIGLETLLTEYSAYDAQDNSTLLSSHNNEFANLNIASRTLHKNGKWNTICVPFDLPIAGSILDGGVARTLANASISENTLTLTFGDAVDTLKAGVPYLIKWTSGDDIVDPTFSCVTIKEDCHPVVFGEGENAVKFIGTYSPVALQKNTTKNLYLGSDNKLYYPTVDDFYVNAFRAYFVLGNDVANSREISVDFGDGLLTGISIKEVGKTTSDKAMYNLAGQRVSKNYKGIVIVNGKKIIK